MDLCERPSELVIRANEAAKLRWLRVTQSLVPFVSPHRYDYAVSELREKLSELTSNADYTARMREVGHADAIKVRE